jgi:hypothetical protein
MRNSFPSQICFVRPSTVWVALLIRGICQTPAQLKYIKVYYQLHQPFVPSKEATESQKCVKTAATKKLRGNATVRRLACSVACELSFSVFRELRCSCVAVSSVCAPPFSSTSSTQSDNNSRKLRLRCGCQFPWCVLAFKGCLRNTQSFII